MPIVHIRRYVLAVAAAILCVLLQKLEGNFEGGPPVFPSDAVPVWRNPDLTFINKFLEYVFPLLIPLGSLTRCSIEVPNHDCMRKAREAPSRGVDMLWGLAFDKTHDEIIEKIPRKDGTELIVRVMVPSSFSETEVERGDIMIAHAPLVFYFHGGGFVLGGSKDAMHATFAQEISKLDTDFASTVMWASVEYRLAPDHPYPAAPEDCMSALEYLTTNPKYNVGRRSGGSKMRKGGIHIAGSSAGGTLAVGTALRALEKGINIDSMLVDSPVFPGPSETHALVTTSSARRMSHSRNLPHQFMVWFMGAYAGCQPHGVESLPPSTMGLLPCNRTDAPDVFDGAMNIRKWKRHNKKLPQMVLVTGEADPLKDGGLAFGEVYEEAGGKVIAFRAQSSHCTWAFFDPETTRRFFDSWINLVK